MMTMTIDTEIDGEYLTVAQFAKRAGLSRQAVYNALQNKLSDFVKVDNGKKTISRKAISLFQCQDELSSCQADTCQVDNENVKESVKLTDELTSALQAQIAQQQDEILRLRSDIDRLRRELDAKDQQIREKDALLSDHMATVSRLAEQAQDIAAREQALHAANLPKLSADGKQDQKPGFFRRLFHSKQTPYDE